MDLRFLFSCLENITHLRNYTMPLPLPLKKRLGFDKDPLFLIDGTSFLYRAFYAYPDLKRSDGLPTNALFIMLRILFKVLREENPKYVGFFLDGRAPTFRHQRMESYKAQRPGMPEPLAVQIKPLLEGVGLLGISTQVADGVEADDCIASLADMHKSERPVVIVGSDKDLFQCLDINVVIWDPGQRTERILTLAEFTEAQGLTPAQWPDFQALVGDKTDNIPGVPGIGPKGALSLLKRHKSLEGLDANFDRLTVKEQEKLGPHRKDIFLYRELTRLRLDSCRDSKLQDFRRTPLEAEGLRDFLERYEFRSLLREFDLIAKPTTEPSPSEGKALPQRELERPATLPVMEGEVGLVWNGEEFRLGYGDREIVWTGAVEPLLRAVMTTRIFTPSLKELLRTSSLWRTIPNERWFDLSLAAYLINPEERDYSWKSIRVRFGAEVEIDPKDEGSFALHQGRLFDARLAGAGLSPLMHTLELPLIPVLIDMEIRGVCIDLNAFSIFLDEVKSRLEELSDQICAMAGTEFNLRSSQQLGSVLFDKLGIRTRRKTPGGANSTSNTVLEDIRDQHPIIPLLLEFRTLEKLRSTYLEPLPCQVDGSCRLHTTFNNLATATGRLSSSNPNLQNIPIRGEFGTRMRSCFTAGEGNELVAADYSQIELRILAHLSGDETLLSAFAHNEDIHTRTAALLFDKEREEVAPDERRKAKTINFGLLYGMGPQKLGRELSIPLNQAKEFITKYFSRLQRIREFYEEVERKAREQGFVTTIFGRRRLLPDINSRNPHLVQQARRMAINTVIQGSAADIIKMAMVKVAEDQQLKELDAALILQVHDELLLEVGREHAREAGLRLAEIMSGVYGLSVPLSVDWGHGRTWAEAH
jgi:DNA polymerase I